MNNLLPAVCIICGCYLLVKGYDGWGWLFLIAALTSK